MRLRIDRDALAGNWRTLDRLSGTATAGAAVKADAYGLGVEHVVPVLREAGARQFFVAHWSEVADVLAHTSGESTAVLHGVANAEEAAYAKATGAIPVINSLAQAQVWHAAGGGTCHVMVDTGINRLGLSPDEIGSAEVQSLEVDTLLSHLASADEDSPKNDQQLRSFREVVATLPARQASLANSAGIALGPDYHFDLTRPGLALYGGVPRPELDGEIKSVAEIEAAVLQVRNLAAGDTVGYNAKWTAKEPTRIAIISLGYADGILRSWGNSGALHHAGTVLPILGRISMDMIAVDCTKSDVTEGDFCSLFYGLPQAAEKSGLSQYELLTVLGQRFDRTS
ncbi:alanine racemase [Aurantiacibacter sp. MUD11]|uniref:alanine racemase n=1 Tax=Aurantiacibacter sp. MUD11 TaxID=3003265 RepID=UPI002ED1C525